jgi:adenine-specific DNA methylase
MVRLEGTRVHSITTTAEFVFVPAIRIRKREYMNFIENESAQKLRGGYYTPLDLATFIARWATEEGARSVLEPSCGDGAFIEALGSLPRELSFTGFELFEDEAAKAKLRAEKIKQLKTEVRAQDFFDFAIPQIAAGNARFDCAVGNPPFIRYQYLPADAQAKSEAIFRLLHLPFTKHTNAWVPFVLASIELLKARGRLGMILPAEIIHVMHSQSLRTYLGMVCSRLLVVDPEELWFDGTLQGAVILLAEKKARPEQRCEGVGIAKVSGRSFLTEEPSLLFKNTTYINGNTVEGKWTRALLTSTERGLLDSLSEHREVRSFAAIANVDVGIVTGANKFFLVHDDIVKEFRLRSFAYAMFGRSEHCPGIIYDQKQHRENARSGNPTNFIWITAPKEILPTRVAAYIEVGEKEKLHTRYKCRIREPWYAVPSVYATSVCMLKRSSDTPRLIRNRLSAYTTDTAYRIKTRQVAPDKLVYCFLNSLTALSAELEGRHYGGGVLELVPSEIEKLLIPLPKDIRPRLHELDELVRREAVVAVLERQSRSILGKLGVNVAKQEQLLGAWLRLKNRRQRVAGGGKEAEDAA